MKKVLLLLLTAALAGKGSLTAQPKNESFDLAFQKAVAALYAYAADPAKPGVAFADGTLQKAFSKVAVESEVGSYSSDWEHRTKRWVWTSVLLRKPKDQQPVARTIQFRNKVDSLLKLVSHSANESSNNRVETAYISDNVSDAAHRGEFKKDEVYLNVVFVKPLTGAATTMADRIDSIIAVYKPGMLELSTAADAANQMGDAMDKNNIRPDDAIPKIATVVRKAADRDIRTAYEIIIKMRWLNEPKALAADLSPEQRGKIRTLAQAHIAAYNAGEDFDARTYTPKAPSAPVYTPMNSGGANAAASTTPSVPMRRCNACDGTGEYDKPDYYHKYDGIFATYETVHTTRVVCPICHGTGKVPDEKAMKKR